MDVRKPLIKTLSTFFYIGFIPLMPGTAASFAGLVLFYFVRGSLLLYTSVTVVCVIAGFMVSGRAEEAFNKKDAQCIVIDEVAGMLFCFLFLPYDLRLFIAGFVLFRLMDTLKPYPADMIQRLHGSLGIMGDDIVAGIYTNIILQSVLSGLSL